MTRTTDRLRLMAMVKEAVDAGARVSKACCNVGVSERTLHRWKQAPDDRRATTPRPVPKNKLSAEEERQVLAICHEPRFATLEEARAWVESFVAWYNEEHLHSGIRYVTPSQRHRGEDLRLLAQRKSVYEAAKMRNPHRWSGQTRNWSRQDEVWLNPERGTLAA